MALFVYYETCEEKINVSRDNTDEVNKKHIYKCHLYNLPPPLSCGQVGPAETGQSSPRCALDT
jgi:hypothetical protein